MHAVFYPLFLGSPLELGVVFIVVLIVFGPGKLPDVLRSLGEGVRQFKSAAEGNGPAPQKALPPNEQN